MSRHLVYGYRNWRGAGEGWSFTGLVKGAFGSLELEVDITKSDPKLKCGCRTRLSEIWQGWVSWFVIGFKGYGHENYNASSRFGQ